MSSYKMPKIAHLPSIPKQALMTLGKMLALCRKEKLWRQHDLAERMGISRQTIARLEKGDANVAIGHYFAAAWILDLPIFPGVEKSSNQVLIQLFELLKDKYPQRILPSEKKIESDF
jgi:transcriptional regulator with XRE-family HTH domain